MRVHFDQGTFGGVYVNLQSTCLVKRRVEQRQEALVRDVRSGIRNITTGFGEDALMVVAVKESVFRLPFAPVTRLSGATDLVRLEACLLEYDEQTATAVSGSRPARDVCLDGEHRGIRAGQAPGTG